MSNVSEIVLPESLRKEAFRLAAEDGVSLSHWVSLAVAQKIGAVESAEEFFRRRGQGASRIDALRILQMVPDGPPLAGDELPEGYAASDASAPPSTR